MEEAVFPALSVIIPTRNRWPTLVGTLEALDRQEGVAGGFEVVVADDGSTDGTAERLAAEIRRHAYPLRFVVLPARGPARARNRAIELAMAPRVLLLGDDTAPEPTTLVEHLRSGEEELGIQGHVDWDPDLPITSVMRFLAPAGPQFYFRGLRAGETIPYTAVLGSNLSAPTSWFREEPFDERFPAAAFEDTELAFRWLRTGRRVVYRPEARCLHRHHYETLGPFLARQRRAGRAARYAIRRHPRIAWRVAVLPAIIGLLRLGRFLWRRARGAATPSDRWDVETRTAFFRGLLFGKS